MAATLGNSTPVLVLGASHSVGRSFLNRLSSQPELQLLAVSRAQPDVSAAGLTWLQHDLAESPVPAMASVLVSFGPIGLALRQLETSPSVGRVIALSSASTEFKSDSGDDAERVQMAAIRADEARLSELCAERRVNLSLFKTTMIYGAAADANVSRLAGLTARLPIVPIAGRGLRQPVHADDLAELAVRVLAMGPVSAGTWLLGGGETLSYPAMLQRIAEVQGRRVQLVSVPSWALKTALRLAWVFGRLRDIRPVMLERQGVDLVVDDQPARERLGWNPGPFRPEV